MASKMVVVFAIFLVVFAALNVSECNADNCFENGMKACTSLYDKYYQNCVMKLPPGACIDSENYRKCLTNHIGSCDIDTCFEDVSIACRSIYPSNYAECATTHHNICGDLQG